MARWRTRAAWSLAALLGLVVGGWIGLGDGAVRACTCGPAEALSMIDESEIVFTASAREVRDPETSFSTLTFEVDHVVKGEVPPSFEIAAGLTDGCGPDYARTGERHVVYLSRWRGHLGLTGCAPLVSADEFERLAGSAPPVEPGGPIAAIGSGSLGLADLVALDAEGRPIGYASIGASGHVAHCAGTTSAVVVSSEPWGDVHLVDLADFEISDSWQLSSAWAWPIDVHCTDGARRVVVVSGSGHEAAPTSFASIDVDTGAIIETERSRIAHTIVRRADVLLALPIDPGSPIEILDAADLTTLAEVSLPTGVSVVHGVSSPHGSQLALLATIDGTTAEYDTGGTDVLVLDIIDGIPVGEPVDIVHVTDSTGTRWPDPDGPPTSEPEPDPDSPGAFGRIDWLADGTWVIDEFAPAGERVHVVDDGVVRRDHVLERCGTDRVATSAGLLCRLDRDVSHLDLDGRLHPRDVARNTWSAVGTLVALVEPPGFDPTFPPPRRLDLTPIEQVTYDTTAAASAMAELLESDRRNYEDRFPDVGRPWANRLGLLLISIGVIGAVGLALRHRRPAT